VDQNGEILVHAQTRIGSDVDDVDTDVAAAAAAVCSFGQEGVLASCDDDSTDVAYRHSVDCVDNVQTGWTAGYSP
jgi:hypothetical protein